MLNKFVNLNLSHAEVVTPVQLHARYYTTGEFADGSGSITTLAMRCTEVGACPQFGRTEHAQAKVGSGDLVQEVAMPP